MFCRKSFLVVVFTVLGVFLLSGCGSTPTTPTPTLTSEEKSLIREYGRGGDYVVRWPDGDIGVYDATGNATIRATIQRALNEWNAVIKSGGGKTRFRLSNDPNSPVKIFYDSSLEGCDHFELTIDNYEITSFELRVSTNDASCGFPDTYYALFLQDFGYMIGIKWEKICPGSCSYEEWIQYTSIFDVNKKAARALYKVPPGYYVGIE